MQEPLQYFIWEFLKGTILFLNFNHEHNTVIKKDLYLLLCDNPLYKSI